VAKRLFIFIAISIFFQGAQGQDLSNLRRKTIALTSDTITLDTLSIIPSSLAVLDLQGNIIDNNLYSFSFGSAEFYPTVQLRSMHSVVDVEFRVFPILFEQTYQKRNYQQHLSPDSLMGRATPRYVVGGVQEPIFGDQIQTNGSIMRGIRFGNGQNLSVNSSMNLTFQGDLGKDLKIEGAISDQSIPLQPEGTTRRLEEFDRIYLRVHRKGFSIQAGDIDLRAGGQGQLLSFTRNVQGLAYNGQFSNPKDTLSVTAALSVPKGKFARNQLQGSEGNQGPYRLQGANGEPYIIVLSGSERVYVDGTLLTRGEDQHYTIDYNAAEVTFTHRMPINRNSRIVVEFEYSERSYSRFTTFGSVHSKGDKWQWDFSVFSEQDSRNQPFDQELTNDQKRHLASIGDDLSQAFLSQADRVDFDPEKLLYQRLDTTVSGTIYSIFRYSTNPTFANYRVYFSYVGQGKGSYTPDFGTANGRVYRWVAPQNGVPQGSYEPIRRLVTPQKKQMVQAGLTRTWSDSSLISASYALSNTDLNTFSTLNSDDNIGHGLQLALAHRFRPLANNLQLGVGADFTNTTAAFRSIDRYRPVEFEHDWSIAMPLDGGGERMLGAWVDVSNPQKIYSKLSAQSLSLGDWYDGNRIGVTGWSKGKRLAARWDASAVNAADTSISSDFIKGKVGLRSTKGFLILGLEGELESNTLTSQGSDSMLAQSFGWYQLRASISTPDTLPAQAEAWYIYRNDYKPFDNVVTLFGSSQEVALSANASLSKAGQISSSVGYRVFTPNTQQFTEAGKEERTALARFEYSNRFAKGLWTFAGSYELGSGLEPDMEYYFVEVPAGQGVYTWVDYNGNGIMELAEFEVANYPDEARFIRINIPGAKMISVRNNALSLRSNISPAVILKDRKGFLNQLAKLSNQTSYRVQQKNQSPGFWQSANPVVQHPTDSLIVSMRSNIRNSLAYNRTSRAFGVEYIYLQGVNKAILANGFELKQMHSHRVVMWLGIGNHISSRTEAEDYTGEAKSQYFVTRNYAIAGQSAQQSVRFISSKLHTAEVVYKWNTSENTTGNEELSSRSISLQTDFAFAGKGSVMGKGSYVVNAFEGNQQSAVAFEMMKGLQNGKNIVWEISVRRRLSKLFELELGYNGRYLSDGTLVHSGSMQARALF
jgi:hypothetical protein